LLARELPENIAHIRDLTCEFVAPKALRTRLGDLCHSIWDAAVSSAPELIPLARRLPPSNQHPLLIHCANGHGRTCLFAAVWLLTLRFVMSGDDAIAMLRCARPGIAFGSRQHRLV